MTSKRAFIIQDREGKYEEHPGGGLRQAIAIAAIKELLGHVLFTWLDWPVKHNPCHPGKWPPISFPYSFAGSLATAGALDRYGDVIAADTVKHDYAPWSLRDWFAVNGITGNNIRLPANLMSAGRMVVQLISCSTCSDVKGLMLGHKKK